MRPVLCLFLLVSCGSEHSTHFLEDASSTVASETKDYPAVVRVIAPNGRGLCTGTIIHSHAVLTASHCTTTPGRYRVVTERGTYYASEVLRHGRGVGGDPDDISLLIFDSAIARESTQEIIPIGQPIDPGDEVRLVGYGCNDVDSRLGTNVKRTGRNRLARRGDFYEIKTPRTKARGLLGPDNLTGTCFGDSGSPLLRTDDRGLWVVGTSHGGQWNSDLLISLFTDLHREANIRFLRESEEGHGLALTRPCEGQRLIQCKTGQATTGIMSFLKWLWDKVFAWFF